MKPTLLDDRMKERILKLIEEGKTMTEVAFFVGISERVLYNWTAKYGDFKEAVLRSRSIADEIVEASLFQRAVGYNCPETKVFFDSQSLTTVKEEITKHYPPDVNAQIHWLNNRDPDRWTNKSEVKHSGKISGDISDKELDQRIMALLSEIKAGADDSNAE